MYSGNDEKGELELHKYTLAYRFFKDANVALKAALQNTKIFLNMVIHDLRNPTNQINFSIKYALERIQNSADMKHLNNTDLYDKMEEI